MEFLNNLRTKSPVYLSIYEDLIIKFAAKQGGTHGSTSETQKFEQSKFFTNKYEIYMYAIILGIQKNYRLPLHDGSKKEKFWEINQWKPKELVDYIIMCLITISDINMNELEDMEEEEINQEIFKLRKLMEEYANGGFDIINSKLKENPDFDNDELCFIDLLDENKFE